jgi:hypothetical protein
VYDPILDNKNKAEVIEDLVEWMFDGGKIEQVKGKENIKWDFFIHNCYKPGVTATCELKTRYDDFGDYAVEISQYADVSNRYFDMKTSGKKKDEIISYLESKKGSGWLFHTEAKIILYVTPKSVSVINTKGLKNYVYANFNKLMDKYSDKTTGAYNKIVPYNKETRRFIKRFNMQLDDLYN